MMMGFFTLLAGVACCLILWRVEPALNHMGCHTRMTVRLAFYLLIVGSSGELWSIAHGESPHWATALLLCGVAALLFFGRRLRGLTPHARRQFIRHP